jgi:hypothetical protein
MHLRFAILYHDGVANPHFDLMFESEPGSKLVTWRSPCWPLLQPVVLTKLPDHRRDYLEYEGPVSGDRGQVKRISSGICTIRKFDNEAFWSIHFPDLQLPRLHIKHGFEDQWLAMLECT